MHGTSLYILLMLDSTLQEMEKFVVLIVSIFGISALHAFIYFII